MKKHYLAALLFLFYIGNATALPDCPSSGYFDNCYGSWAFDNGDKYVGEWKENKKNGQGTLIWSALGDKYVGEFKDNNMHGQGTYYYPSGDKYIGEWKDNNINGQGTMTFANGDKYVGEWKDNNMNGQGTYTYANGTTERGYFSNNEFVPDICEGMGLTKGSDGFAQCVLKLMDD